MELSLLTTRLDSFPILKLLKLDKKILANDYHNGCGILRHEYEFLTLLHIIATKFKSSRVITYVNQFLL